MKADKATKELLITIQYVDSDEALRELRRIELAIRQGRKKYDRIFTESTVVEWAIQRTAPVPYREEQINGVWCQIFKSRMNEI